MVMELLMVAIKPHSIQIEELDTDGDGIADQYDTDDDGDNVPDEEEIRRGTDPLNPDTDWDGLNDKEEELKATNPLNADSDSDGVLDGEDDFPPILLNRLILTMTGLETIWIPMMTEMG